MLYNRRNDVLSILERRFGRDTVRNAIKQHGSQTMVAIASALYRQYMDWQPSTPARVGYTPKHDPPSYRSQSKSRPINRVQQQIKRKLDFSVDTPTQEPASRMRRSRIGMARRNAGVYKGGFRKAKRKKRSPVKWDAVCKDQRSVGTTADDPECVYNVHCTHPARYVLRMIAMAMVKKYYNQCGVKVKAWEDFAAIPYAQGTGTSSPGVNLVVTYQERLSEGASFNGNPITATWYGNTIGDTFLDMADTICDSMVGTITGTANDFNLIRMDWQPVNVSVSDQQLSLRSWDPVDVFITVKGASHMCLQNRTEGGESGGTNENALITSIYANPLQGKHYVKNGAGFLVKHITMPLTAPVVAASRQLVCDSTTGFYSMGSTNTSFDPVVRDVLKQPPNYRFFSGCHKSGKVRLEPGAIKNSYISATETHSINGWFRVLYHFLASGSLFEGTEASANSAVGAVRKISYSKPGKCAMIAMEKVASFGVATIKCQGERDAIYCSKMYFRTRKFTPATNNALSPITAAPAP